MNFRRYIAKKAVFVVLTILLITAFNFFIFQVMPGDPTYAVTPRGCGGANSSIVGSCAIRDQLIAEWGLNKPVLQRFVIYMANLFQGNLGTSITSPGRGESVVQVIAQPLVVTLELIGLATVVTMWAGMLLGRISGWRRGSGADITITLTTLAGYSMPSFWISLVVVWVFAYQTSIFILPGSLRLSADPLEAALQQVYYYIPAIIVFLITNVAWFSLTLRNSLTDVLPEDYMVTAAAKGLTPSQQLRWHALPNARLPVVTASALYFGWVVSGVIVIETVFNINGLGSLTWTATENYNYPLLSGVFLIATVGVVLCNAVADVLYMFLDPRVREA